MWNVSFLANWTGGTLKLYLPRLAELFDNVPVRDIGLVASEGRFSIPLSDDSPAGVAEVTRTDNRLLRGIWVAAMGAWTDDDELVIPCSLTDTFFLKLVEHSECFSGTIVIPGVHKQHWNIHRVGLLHKIHVAKIIGIRKIACKVFKLTGRQVSPF